MVYRIFVEKKEGLDNEARGLLAEAKNLLSIDALENVRLFNRYDAEKITEELFGYCVKTVFSEPQLDNVSAELELPGAINKAYEAAKKISFTDMHMRSDIGQRALNELNK